MKQNTELFEQALLSLDRLAAWDILQQTETGNTPIQLIEQVVVPAMERIGDGWNQGRLALSQVYMSGRICEELVERLLPKDAPERKNQPRMAITVLNDYHLLGKRIIYAALRACGYELSDYGRTTSDELADRVRKDGIEILLISALMLPAALKVSEVVANLKKTDSGVRVIVGGAPFLFDAELWKSVGADAMGKNATQAIKIIEDMTGGAL